jgi:hypothetical protein
MNTRREMNALPRVNAEEMAAHHAGALAAGVRSANAMDAPVNRAMKMRLGSRLSIAGGSSQRSLSLGSRTILEGRKCKVRICLFFLPSVLTTSLEEGVCPILQWLSHVAVTFFDVC